ncbi:hypothetical protein SDC9_131063 [bioreactor metagenome]|uniref:Uncharacterized protein n=1 Tax=bioreactor metagenome TaxID=1076179 RepID=A0A645D4M4_9ZZZZ
MHLAADPAQSGRPQHIDDRSGTDTRRTPIFRLDDQQRTLFPRRRSRSDQIVGRQKTGEPRQFILELGPGAGNQRHRLESDATAGNLHQFAQAAANGGGGGVLAMTDLSADFRHCVFAAEQQEKPGSFSGKGPADILHHPPAVLLRLVLAPVDQLRQFFGGRFRKFHQPGRRQLQLRTRHQPRQNHSGHAAGHGFRSHQNIT